MFHETVPSEYKEKVCESCSAHSCVFEILQRWSSPAPRVASGYFFQKMYVVHYTPRSWRKTRMIERAKEIGIPTMNEDGVLAFVDDFDADDFSGSDMACLRAAHDRRLGKKLPILSPAQLSVNSKHYAAMLDMLRWGIQYALVVEDDATFVSGFKVIHPPKSKHFRAHFDVAATYDSKRPYFNETITRFVEPHLPTKAKSPWPTKTTNATYLFDHLALGACDGYWHRVYAFGKGLGRHVHGDTALRRGVRPFSGHVSVSSWSCTRCLIAYIASLAGASRLLHSSVLPWVASIDIHVTWASGSKASNHRPLDCLWLEPPIVWEDPGLEGDGLQNAATLHNRHHPTTNRTSSTTTNVI